MQALFILLIVLGFLFLLFIGTIIWFSILFLVNKRTVIWIKQSNHTWKTKTYYKQNLPEQVTIDNDIYIIDKDSIIRSKWSYNLYYYKGLMYPMNMDKEKALSTIPSIKLVDGNITKRILKSDLVTKLITTDNIKAIMLILLIVILLITIIILVMTFIPNTNNACVLIGDNQTRDAIAMGVKYALGK